MRQLLAEDIPDDIKRILGAVDEDTEWYYRVRLLWWFWCTT
jgi:hypothetical protein